MAVYSFIWLWAEAENLSLTLIGYLHCQGNIEMT